MTKVIAMEIALAWFVFSFLAAWIANEKGRGVGWVFLLSLVASPLVGIIVAFALRPRDAQAPTVATHRHCPDCQEWILRTARKCKHCGTVFAEAPAGTIRCPHCDRPNAAGNAYCDVCGGNLHAVV